MHCEWLIETEDVHTLILKFEDFSVEKITADCEHDSVKVRHIHIYFKNENEKYIK